MTSAEFKEARLRLRLTQRATANLLGISPRQVIRYEKVTCEVPEPIARLLWLLVAEQIPPWRVARIFQVDLNR